MKPSSLMTKAHQREPPSLEMVLPPVRSNERLDLVQGLFPNDDLQLQEEGEKKVVGEKTGILIVVHLVHTDIICWGEFLYTVVKFLTTKNFLIQS